MLCRKCTVRSFIILNFHKFTRMMKPNSLLRCGMDTFGSGQQTNSENGNEFSALIKSEKCLGQLSDWYSKLGGMKSA